MRSVCTQDATLQPLKWFAWNLEFESISRSYQQSQSLVKIEKEDNKHVTWRPTRVSARKSSLNSLNIYRSEMFRTGIVQKHETSFMSKTLFLTGLQTVKPKWCCAYILICFHNIREGYWTLNSGFPNIGEDYWTLNNGFPNIGEDYWMLNNGFPNIGDE
jgi:hypothetical protein